MKTPEEIEEAIAMLEFGMLHAARSKQRDAHLTATLMLGALQWATGEDTPQASHLQKMIDGHRERVARAEEYRGN